MRLGPLVLGDKGFQEQQEQYLRDKERAFAYGPMVADGPGPKASQPEQASPARAARASKGDLPLLSIKELELALSRSPSAHLIDQLIEAEFGRPEGKPRARAISLLLQAERSRGERARAAVIKELEAALGG